jgi:hypothetical protein
MATLSELRDNPQAQRKFFIFGAVLLVTLGWLILPSWFSHYKAEARARANQQAIEKAAAMKPSPVVAPVAAPVVAPAPVPVPVPAPDPYGVLLGKWIGQTTLAERGTCGLYVELNKKDDKTFAGFSTVSCSPSVFELIAKRKAKKPTPGEIISDNIKAMNPVSSSFTGMAKDGAVVLQAVENIGVSASIDGCEMLSMTLREFGDGRLSVKWQEKETGKCHGGEMIAVRR